MIAQASAGGGFGLGAKLLRFLFIFFFDIGKDVGQNVDDIVPGRARRVGEYQLRDVLRMSGGISHGNESAIGVTEQRKSSETKSLAHGVEVSDLGVH